MTTSLSADPGRNATVRSVVYWALAFAGLLLVQLTLLSLRGSGSGPSPTRLRLHRARIALRQRLRRDADVWHVDAHASAHMDAAEHPRR